MPTEIDPRKIRIFANYEFCHTDTGYWDWGVLVDFHVKRTEQEIIITEDSSNKQQVINMLMADLDLAAHGRNPTFLHGNGGIKIGNDVFNYRIYDYTALYMFVRDCCKSLGFPEPKEVYNPVQKHSVPSRINQHSVAKTSDIRLTGIYGSYKLVLLHSTTDRNSQKPITSKVTIEHRIPNINSLQDGLLVLAHSIEDILDRINSWPSDNVIFDAQQRVVMIELSNGNKKTYLLNDIAAFKAFTAEILPFLRINSTSPQSSLNTGISPPAPQLPNIIDVDSLLNSNCSASQANIAVIAPTTSEYLLQLCGVTKKERNLKYNFFGGVRSTHGFNMLFEIHGKFNGNTKDTKLSKELDMLNADHALAELAKSSHPHNNWYAVIFRDCSGEPSNPAVIDYSSFEQWVFACFKDYGHAKSNITIPSKNTSATEQRIVRMAGGFSLVYYRNSLDQDSSASRVFARSRFEADPSMPEYRQLLHEFVFYLEFLTYTMPKWHANKIDFDPVVENCVRIELNDGTTRTYSIKNQAELQIFLKDTLDLLHKTIGINPKHNINVSQAMTFKYSGAPVSEPLLTKDDVKDYPQYGLKHDPNTQRYARRLT